MAFRERGSVTFYYAGDVKNDIAVKFDNITNDTAQLSTAAAAFGPLLSNKMTADVTAEFDFAALTPADTIIANGE